MGICFETRCGGISTIGFVYCPFMPSFFKCLRDTTANTLQTAWLIRRTWSEFLLSLVGDNFGERGMTYERYNVLIHYCLASPRFANLHFRS